MRDALESFGEVANDSIEVPGQFGAWHYRLAAVNYGKASIILLTLKEKDGRENVTDIQILKGINLKKEKGRNSCPGSIPQKSAPSAVTVAHLTRAWEDVFVSGLMGHL